MGSKNSIKSKSQHLAHVESLLLKDRIIEWLGNGIYVFNRTAGHYQIVTEMKDLEFKMTSQNFEAPVYVRKDQFGELICWG